MKEDIIQYIGVDKLEDVDQNIVYDLTQEYWEKIRRSLKNITSMIVHLKEYKKQGKRSKYSLNIRAIAPTQIFESTKASDWDLPRALHKAFKDLERQIQHKLHTDEQH